MTAFASLDAVWRRVDDGITLARPAPRRPATGRSGSRTESPIDAPHFARSSSASASQLATACRPTQLVVHSLGRRGEAPVMGTFRFGIEAERPPQPRRVVA